MSELYRINGSNIIHEAFEDEVIVLNMNNGNYFSLSKTSADIWKLIETGATVPAIVNAMKQRYDGNDSEVETAVTQFVNQLAEENLVAAVEDRADSRNHAESGIDPPKERKPFQAPIFQKFSDMQEMLLLDPIHDVDESGWPGVPRISTSN